MKTIYTGIVPVHTVKSIPSSVDVISISDDAVNINTNINVSGKASFVDYTLINRPYLLCDLSSDIAYSTNSSINEYIGESPNWFIDIDTTSSFNQTNKIYTIPKNGVYEIKLSIFTASTGSYVQAYVELIRKNQTNSFREFVLEYSENAYNRNGSINTPRLLEGDKIRIRVLPFASSSTITFRGQRIPSGNANSRRSFNYFTIYWLTDI